jgi:hypothetical protein
MSLKEGVCITHGTMIKSCSSKGCTNGAAKEGVCCMHGSKSINTNNISTIQSNAIPSSIPPLHQSIDYEEEEELNSWIWKSCRIPRQYMERGDAALRGVATESLRKEFAALMAQRGNDAATRGVHSIPRREEFVSLTEQRSSDVALRIRYHGLARDDFE